MVARTTGTADNLAHGVYNDLTSGVSLGDDEILNVIAQELQQSAGGNENDFIDANRQNALSYYLGSSNGKEVEGRSTIISTDVADCIEWIMPAILKQFTSNNEIVHFDPVFEGDENQAMLESQYVYDILMKENDGFNIIYTLVKDCLMQKNGILKSYYDVEDVDEVKWYTGLGPAGLQVLMSQNDVEMIEYTENPPEYADSEPTYDVKVRIRELEGKIIVMTIPPEEFRLSRQHNSINVDTARFSAHVLLKTRSELIKQGYDEDMVNHLNSGANYDDDRDYRFYMQGETVYPDREVSVDRSQDLIEIAECFIFIDIDNTGVAERYKVVTSGGDNPDSLLGYERVDSQPFNGAAAILMSHKFFGLSIYDRLRQIQDQKTTLWRNMFDNLYLQNNQRNVVIEGQVNLDDLLVSRPGGIVRAKSQGAVQALVTPAIGPEAGAMMDYLDKVRAGRSGASPEGNVQIDNIGDRVGSEGVARLLTAKEELVGLMTRVIAETGIKPLMYRIRDLAILHNDVIEDYKFRGYWTQTQPSEWIRRSNSTVRVGTGTGDREQITVALQKIIDLQGSMVDDETTKVLINHQKVFNAVNDFGKAAGLLGVREYFVDPESPEGKQAMEQQQQQQTAQQEEMQKKDQAMMQLQVSLAKAETDKAKAQLGTAAAKAEESAAKLNLEHQQQISDLKLEQMKLQLKSYEILGKAAGQDQDTQYKYDELNSRESLELTRIEAKENTDENENYLQNKETVSAK